MNNFTERTWMSMVMGEELKKIMAILKHPLRKLRALSYTGPVTLSDYQRFQSVRDALAQEGISLPMPTGN